MGTRGTKTDTICKEMFVMEEKGTLSQYYITALKQTLNMWQ